MIDELLLHIGPPKTGTTTIQAALSLAAPEAAEKGTFIPTAEGDEPGQHLPILREVVGETVMKERYAFSHDRLSLEEVLRAATDARCSRLLISAEEFATAPEDVLVLIRAIGPKRVTVLQALRPVVPWMLSVFAQYVKYGLNEMATWPLGRFAEFFAEVILPAPVVGVERWKDGPWELRTRTMFLVRSPDIALGGKFSRLADLPVPLLPSRPANERLDTCSLHLLQALNLLTFEDPAPLPDRAESREYVLASMRSRGVPPHECRCAERLSPETQEYLAERASRLLPGWLSASERILGEPSTTIAVGARDHVHSAYPGPDGLELASRVLLNAVGARGVRV